MGSVFWVLTVCCTFSVKKKPLPKENAASVPRNLSKSGGKKEKKKKGNKRQKIKHPALVVYFKLLKCSEIQMLQTDFGFGAKSEFWAVRSRKKDRGDEL